MQSNDPQMIVKRYQAEGLHLVIYPTREKGPKGVSAKDWQLHPLSSADFTSAVVHGHNVGLLLGEDHNRIADIDLDSSESLSLADSFLPESEWIFGRRSRPRSHRLYRVSGLVEYIRVTDPLPLEQRAVHIELRWGKSDKGFQTMIPPSVHPSGERVEWESFDDLIEVQGPKLTQSVNLIGAAAILARHWYHGQRQDIALALVGGLLRSGWDEATTAYFVESICSSQGDGEVEKRLDLIARTTSRLKSQETVYGWRHLSELIGDATVKKVRQLISSNRGASDDDNERTAAPKKLQKIPMVADYLLTEGGNADVFVRMYRDRVRHVLARGDGTWYVYDGIAWRKDFTRQVGHLARAAIRSIAETAIRGRDDISDDDCKKLIAHFMKSDNAYGVNNLLKLARDKPGITISREQFDRDPWLLNTPSGTIDLKTNELRQHQRADYITKTVNAEVENDAECPTWMSFLDRAAKGNTSIVDYLQKAVGYTLTGSTQEKCIFFLIGPTNTGKSIFTEVLAYVFGDYAQHTAVETFLHKERSSGNSNDVAALAGARYVYASEPGEGKKLREELVKALTGGDKQTVRFLFEEFFDLTTQFKAWIGANHFPKVEGVDDSIWSRLKEIPFSVQIPDAEQIPRDQFLKQLQAESAGILRWALQGVTKYNDEGLKDPDWMRKLVNERRADNDAIGLWIEECVVFAPAGSSQRERDVMSTTLSDAYSNFQDWSIMAGVNAKRFSRQTIKSYFVERHGIEARETPGGHGITLCGMVLIGT